LNDLNKVTPEVDAHVRKVAQDLGYSRNRIAAALKTGRRNVIGCIFLSPVRFPEILQAVQRRAEEHGYATFVVDSGRGGGREEEAAQVLYRHGVDGVVAVLDARPKIVSEPLFPIVVIDRHVQDWTVSRPTTKPAAG
jgi:LacI family transcriptional regulator